MHTRNNFADATGSLKQQHHIHKSVCTYPHLRTYLWHVEPPNGRGVGSIEGKGAHPVTRSNHHQRKGVGEYVPQVKGTRAPVSYPMASWAFVHNTSHQNGWQTLYVRRPSPTRGMNRTVPSGSGGLMYDVHSPGTRGRFHTHCPPFHQSRRNMIYRSQPVQNRYEYIDGNNIDAHLRATGSNNHWRQARRGKARQGKARQPTPLAFKKYVAHITPEGGMGSRGTEERNRE